MTTEPVVLTDAVIQAAQDLRTVRDGIAELKAQETQLRDMILAALDTGEKGITASGSAVAHIETQVRRVISRDKLEAMHPAVFASVVEERTVKVLKIDITDEVTL